MKEKMQAILLINKTREYLDYVERHINNVQKAFREVENACVGMTFIGRDESYWALRNAVYAHDISKLSKHELTQYRDFFYPVGEKPSPPVEAFEHHYMNNDHHWENWTNSDMVHADREICCAHMVIDWLAMSYEFGDTPRQYYENNHHKINIPDPYINFLYEIFSRLEGTEVTPLKQEVVENA